MDISKSVSFSLETTSLTADIADAQARLHDNDASRALLDKLTRIDPAAVDNIGTIGAQAGTQAGANMGTAASAPVGNMAGATTIPLQDTTEIAVLTAVLHSNSSMEDKAAEVDPAQMGLPGTIVGAPVASSAPSGVSASVPASAEASAQAAASTTNLSARAAYMNMAQMDGHATDQLISQIAQTDTVSTTSPAPVLAMGGAASGGMMALLGSQQALFSQVQGQMMRTQSQDQMITTTLSATDMHDRGHIAHMASVRANPQTPARTPAQASRTSPTAFPTRTRTPAPRPPAFASMETSPHQAQAQGPLQPPAEGSTGGAMPGRRRPAR